MYILPVSCFIFLYTKMLHYYVSVPTLPIYFDTLKLNSFVYVQMYLCQ